MMLDVTVKTMKLTKSMVSQMLFLPAKNLKDAEVLGMLVNVHKKHPKVMLLAFNNDFYLFVMDWMCGDDTFYKQKGTRTTWLQFDSEEECKKCWEVYTACKEEAEKIHIYI